LDLESPQRLSRRYGPQSPAWSVSLLLVQSGRYRLAVPSRLVRAVVPASEVVPLGLKELEGLLWRDGALLPALALGPLLGTRLRRGRAGLGHGVLVHSDRGLICFMVDEALDLVEVPGGSIRPLPPLVIRATGLVGVESVALLDPLLLVIDPVRILGAERVEQVVEAAAKVGAQGAQPGV
jgi:hypothetical protein